jgi:hypothetical protein
MCPDNITGHTVQFTTLNAIYLKLKYRVLEFY